MTQSAIIIGAGGHGKVLADALRALGHPVLGFADTNPEKWNTTVLGLRILGGDDAVSRQPTDSVLLVNGVGSAGSLAARRATYLRFTELGYRFMTVVHPRATVARSARVGDGVQVMAGAVVQADARLGDNTIINTGAIVDHDCIIGRHCHIAPGCALSGGVEIADECHVGTGVSIRQGVVLGARTIVGAGAAIVSDFPGECTLAGVPARPVEKR